VVNRVLPTVNRVLPAVNRVFTKAELDRSPLQPQQSEAQPLIPLLSRWHFTIKPEQPDIPVFTFGETVELMKSTRFPAVRSVTLCLHCTKPL